MLRDVFYYGNKPNVHPREKYAINFEDARKQATTEHFWIINEYCDYRGFNWDFDYELLPDDDVWAEEHINIWPSIHQKDSGTWLVANNDSEVKIYRADVEPLKRTNEKHNCWVVNDKIDETKFDLTWHPDPTEPPYIYKWGSRFYPVQVKACLEYHTPGATDIKYMPYGVELLPEWDRWEIPDNVDKSNFDFTWRPDPREPAYIYEFGTQWHTNGGPRYICDNATEVKYTGINCKVKETTDNWEVLTQRKIKNFDYSWHPSNTDEPYIYVFGNHYYPAEVLPTIQYVVPGATQIKYVHDIVATLDVNIGNWVTHEDVIDFDYSWFPHPNDPPYIYQWGNKFYGSDLKPTVEYIVPNATDIKHMSQDVKLKPTNNWTEYCNIDKNKFDYSWRPDPTSPPYIYVWGNKHVPGVVSPTIEYTVEGASEYKFVSDDVEVLPELDKWNIIDDIDFKKFDFTWRPNPKSPPYIYAWGNKHVSAELKPTIEYIVPNATEYKFMDELVEVLPQTDRWVMYQQIDKTEFDLTWRPDPTSPPYIYVWGNKYIAGELQPTIEYHTPGATEKKYMQEPLKVLPISENWKILQEIDRSKFDLSWRPDPREPDYIYVWGNKYIPAELESTLEYHVLGATEIKYMGNVDVEPQYDRWNILIPVDKSSFDFTWRPDPREPAYIYVWGNKYNDAQREPTIEYHTPGATQRKYMNDRVATTLPDMDNWTTHIPVESFDYSWRPDPKSPPYIYVFGNKWNDPATEPTVEYNVKGATDYKYISDIIAITKPNLQYWQISNNDDLETFDFSWRPNPKSPPQIYQWENNGPRYIMPDASDVVLMKYDTLNQRTQVKRYHIKTTLEDLINEHSDEVFWAINPDLNYSKFDFSWRPNEENFRHINVFGNEYSKDTQTYYVNGPLYMMGHHEYNYVEGQKVEIDSNLSMFFVDRSNEESTARFNELKARYPQLQKTRYLNSWVDTINRCLTRATTNLCWILNSELDYSDFDFNFYPSPWQTKMIHIFGTQWNHWGTTFMINKETFHEGTQYLKLIEHANPLNFVKSKRAKANTCLYDVVLVDHENNELDDVKKLIKSKTGKTPTVIKYNRTYLQTFKNYLKTLLVKKEHYVWICSSICDYTNFDFSYIADPFAKDQLHVFPSNKQKFGDTFLVDVNKFISLVDDMAKLEDYNKVNFNQTQRVNRFPAPVIQVNEDTHVNLTKYEFEFPYAIFETEQYNIEDQEPLNLWEEETKNILITSNGGTRIIVPREIYDYPYIKELYDFPYIKTASKLMDSHPMDIVFLSNGEKNAEENYEHLLHVTKKRKNRVVHVEGVNGRVNAYHASATASLTPWAFTVFAKLKVDENFNWDWQPDRLQIPKHYIFIAKNPLNGLEYGHQATIAYNKKLVLNNPGLGLDFTLDDPHETVDMLSGVANFNTDKYSTWRTAFREVIKLKADFEDISQERLNTWLTIAEGEFAEDCLQGAKDAVAYYNEVNGDIDKLKLSYEWEWLRNYYDNKSSR